MSKKERGHEGPKQDTHANFRAIGASQKVAVPTVPKQVMDRLIRNAGGLVANCEFNAITIISGMPAFDGVFYDDFAQQQRIADGRQIREWTDEDDTLATACLQRMAAPALRREVVRAAIAAVARERRRNPLQDCLIGLHAWDGAQRIERFWIDTVGAPDDEHHRAAGRNFFTAMIARAMQPGCELHEAYVLEGDQAIGKNEVFKALGGPYYRESRYKINSIDFLRTLRGAWIFHMPELGALSGAKAEAIKNVVSGPSDDYPEKYEKHARTYPRTCVIVGSTNEDEYLNDPTGNRRFIPIRCTVGRVNVDLVKASRDQLLAEALHRFRQGGSWHEFPASTRQVQADRVVHDAWDSPIIKYIEGRTRVTIFEVLKSALELNTDRMSKQAQGRAAATLRKLNWRKAGRTRTEGGQTTEYVAPGA
jgi:putative DNA primase/helicase